MQRNSACNIIGRDNDDPVKIEEMPASSSGFPLPRTRGHKVRASLGNAAIAGGQ